MLNAPQLVDRVRPLLREYLGAEADTLAVGEAGAGFRAQAGAATHDMPNRGCLAHFLFGTREARPTSAPSTGPLAEAFPLPTLWYGVNYV